MRYFVEVQTVTVVRSLIDRARYFAKQVTPTIGTPGMGYGDANQSDLQKIEFDHFISKVGEEAVRIVYEQFKRQVQGPDYQIYKGNQKSWGSDLYIDGTGLAVKTQTSSSARRFGLSWTFQAGIYRKDPILNNPNAWVSFVEVNESTYQCRVYPAYQIKELKFGEPKIERLKGSKKVVYVESLSLVS